MEKRVNWNFNVFPRQAEIKIENAKYKILKN